MAPEPLEGFQILELGDSEAAGMCTLLVSDFGARVTRIRLTDSPLPAEGYRICDRGKKIRTLNLAEESDRIAFMAMTKSADALVSGLQPGEAELEALEAAGFSMHEIRRINPSAVIISVTPYGTEGPYACHSWSEACVQAESGFVSTTGPENGDPVRCGGNVATFAGGMNACIALLMGLYDSMSGRGGRTADVSLMDSIVFGLENQLSLSIRTGIVPKPRGNHYALSAPVGNFPCRDGKEIMISVATEAQWETFARVLGHEEWLEKTEYLNVSRRIANVDQLSRDVTAAFMEHDSQEVMEILQTRSCVYGRINTFPDVVAHPQAKARNVFRQATAPDGTVITLPANPVYTAKNNPNLWIFT